MTEQTDSTQNRIRWRCHRGMLEIDLLLLPFCDQQFPKLSAEDQILFEELLECTDPEIFAWLMGHEVCEDERIQNIVNQIRAFHKNAV